MQEKRNLILVGVDLSSCSKRALIQAGRLAQQNGSTLLILHVIEPLVIRNLSEALSIPREQLSARAIKNARKAVEDFVKDLDLSCNMKIDVEIDSPIDSILARLEEASPDLLVLGKVGDWESEKGAGTVAAACVRKAPLPVLLVDEAHEPPFENVLVGVDFSDHSKRAVQYAVDIAAQDGSRLQLLHVFTPPWNHFHYKAPTSECSPDFKKQYLASLEGLLKGSIDPFREKAKDIKISYQLLPHPGYGQGIVEYARRDQVDLVVVGTRGQTNLRYLFLGRTAERVLKDVDCSVLTIPLP